MNQQQRRYIEGRIWRMRSDAIDRLNNIYNKLFRDLENEFPDAGELSYEQEIAQIKSGKAKMKPKSKIQFDPRFTTLNLVFDFLEPTPAQRRKAQDQKRIKRDKLEKDKEAKIESLENERRKQLDVCMLGDSPTIIKKLEAFEQFCKEL